MLVVLWPFAGSGGTGRSRLASPMTMKPKDWAVAAIDITSCPLRGQIDPRALRFSAAATAVVLAIVLLTAGVARPLA